MPHTKRQLDNLNRLLFDLPDDCDAMLLTEFDGFVASLIVCPELIPPSEWLPIVWGEEQASDFEDLKEAQTTVNAIMGHYNVVALDLAKPEPEYEAILEIESNSDASLWEPWISGFERGMQLRPHCWEVMVESDDEEVSSIIPMLLTLHQISHGQSKLDEDAIDHLDAIAPELIPDMVLKLNSWTKAQHQTNPGGTGTDLPKRNRKPGRNSPCPCGSGKKFKKCCGTVTLH